MKGLDCGTGNYVAASVKGLNMQRNAFLAIDKATTTIKSGDKFFKTLNSSSLFKLLGHLKFNSLFLENFSMGETFNF